jgi:hypothetical protein
MHTVSAPVRRMDIIRRFSILFLLLPLSPMEAVSISPHRAQAESGASTIDGRGHARQRSASHPSIVIPGKPKPREEWYKRCPPWGHGGDVEADLLRNRIDPATHPRVFTATQFLHLTWPGAVSRRAIPMARWSRSDRRKAFRYEGMAASLEGNLVAFDRLGPSEPTNCGGKAGYDWHFWIGTSYQAARKASIIAEATPRVRVREHGFDWKTFATLAGQAKKIRVTGWIFLDNDHHLDDSDRATLWEIHPITRIDVWGKHGWSKVAG